MKKMFKGYYRPTDEEYKKLWDECYFIFDTNVLLKLYRYSKSTREKLIKIIKSLQERVWIPNQVGHEFHQRRPEVIKKQYDIYSEIEKDLDKMKNDFLRKYSLHPYIDIQKVNEYFEKIKTYINQRKEKHPNLLKSDSLLDTISEIFEGKIGEGFDEAKIEDIYKEGKKRYDRKIPPGYCDNKKEEDSKFGDLVLWKQIIEKVKADKKLVIFVTDDSKEDWWQIVGKDTTLGPRPELKQEIHREAGVDFHMYNADQFIKLAMEYLKEEPDEKMIEEMKTIREEDEKRSEIREDEVFITPSSTTYFDPTSQHYIISGESSPPVFTSTGVTIKGDAPTFNFGRCDNCEGMGVLKLCRKCNERICSSCQTISLEENRAIFSCPKCLSGLD